MNGEYSEWQEVLSGIPQGSVLGPILFVVYINTLPEAVKDCEVFLFADDTKMFKGILKHDDCAKLQNNINCLYDWTTHSLLKFHTDKCGVMRIGRSKLKESSYTMGPEKHVLRKITEEKDIGVIIDDKLSFSSSHDCKSKQGQFYHGLHQKDIHILGRRDILTLI